jgi:ABC-type transport system substrate-binding protein
MVIPSLVLAACQPAAQSVETEEPAPSTDSGNSITIIIAEDPPSFNPMVADTGYDALVMELVMLGMTDVDPDGHVFPELAANYRLLKTAWLDKMQAPCLSRGRCVKMCCGRMAIKCDPMT